MINLSATNFSAIVILYKFDRTTPEKIDNMQIHFYIGIFQNI